jgi:hypothetical protein
MAQQLLQSGGRIIELQAACRADGREQDRAVLRLERAADQSFGAGRADDRERAQSDFLQGLLICAGQCDDGAVGAEILQVVEAEKGPVAASFGAITERSQQLLQLLR